MRFGSTPRAERLPKLREKKIVGCTWWSTKAREIETASWTKARIRIHMIILFEKKHGFFKITKADASSKQLLLEKYSLRRLKINQFLKLS